MRIQGFLLHEAKHDICANRMVYTADELKEKDSELEIDPRISFDKVDIGLAGKPGKTFLRNLTVSFQPGVLNVILGTVGCVCQFSAISKCAQGIIRANLPCYRLYWESTTCSLVQSGWINDDAWPLPLKIRFFKSRKASAATSSSTILGMRRSIVKCYKHAISSETWKR